MENNKFWIYLGLGVVAALSLKWFNSSDSSVSSNRWSIGANMADEIQYKRSTRTHTPISGLSERRTTPVLTQVQSGTTAAPAAAAKKDVKLQNVAKKKDDKKKKKKKKKKPRITGVPADALTEREDETIEARNVPNGGAAAPLAFEGTTAPAAPAAASLTDWERILLVSANHRETIRFIGLYQTKQITAEVFYGIIGQMINDSRSQMRQLGITALAATPSLESYEMLIASNESETGPLKTQSTRLIDETYNRPQAINIIYAALTREVSVATQLQALNNLSALISNLRTPSSQALESSDQVVAPSRTELVTQQRVFEYFKRLQTDAMPKLRQSKDPRVQALAQTVSGQLMVALNSATQPVQPVAANGN